MNADDAAVTCTPQCSASEILYLSSPHARHESDTSVGGHRCHARSRHRLLFSDRWLFPSNRWRGVACSSIAFQLPPIMPHIGPDLDVLPEGNSRVGSALDVPRASWLIWCKVEADRIGNLRIGDSSGVRSSHMSAWGLRSRCFPLDCGSTDRSIRRL